MNKKAFWIISTIIIGTLWYFQNVITVNIPWWDDFHGIILPIFDLFSNLSSLEKFKGFVSLNNEHRVVNDRIFTLLVYLVTGKFNLKLLALLGFINLIGIFYIFVHFLRRYSIAYLAIIPIPLLIFHAQYYESLQSLMVPFQNFSVLLYMSLSFYFLIIKEKTGWAFALALAAIFSHGNGILVFLIAAIILLLNDKKKRLLWWGLSSGLVILIYFWGYSRPAWANKSVVSPLESPISAIRYVFEFLGAYSLNIVEVSDSLNQTAVRQVAPQITGLILTIILIILILKKYPLKKDSLSRLQKDKKNQFILSFSAFFVGTALMMGMTRTGFPILSRYTINSSLFIIAIWSFYLLNFKGKKLYWPTIFITTLLLLLSYYNNTYRGIDFRNKLIADAFNFQENTTWVNNYADTDHVSRVNPLLKGPLEAGDYIFPRSILDDYKKWPTKYRSNSPDFSIVDRYLNISGNTEVKSTFFSLESENNTFLFPAERHRNSPKNILKERGYFSTSFSTFFPYQLIPEGRYNIYKIEIADGEGIKYKLNRTLDTKGLVL